MSQLHGQNYSLVQRGKKSQTHLMPGVSAKVQEYFEVILNLIKNVRKDEESSGEFFISPASSCLLRKRKVH